MASCSSCSSSSILESGLRTGIRQQRFGAKQKRMRVVMAMQSSAMIDSHLVLGIDQNASRQEIKRAYRSLALQYHPDVCKGTDKEHLFTQINLAYECLMSDFQSQEQDCTSASGSNSRHVMQDEWLSEGYTFEDIFGEQQQQQQPVDDFVFFASGKRDTNSTTKPHKVKRSCVREDW